MLEELLHGVNYLGVFVNIIEDNVVDVDGLIESSEDVIGVDFGEVIDDLVIGLFLEIEHQIR